MSATTAGEGSFAFRGNSFHAARNVAARVLRPPEQPATTKPLIVGATGLGSGGAYLSATSDAAYGDVIISLGLNQVAPYVLTMRFPGTTTGGSPATAGGLFVVSAGMTITQADVVATPGDVQWTVTPLNFGALDPLRQLVIHYEWNVSH